MYALSRNGTDQGKTTVVLFRRDEARAIETNEVGSAGAARAHIVAAFAYADFAVQSYVGSYQAPFVRTSPLGRPTSARPHPAGVGTVRYAASRGSLSATIDGVRGTGAPAARDAWIFDAPFMTGAVLVPALRHRTGDPQLGPVSEAFDEGANAPVAERYVSAAPRFPKTPKSDAALNLDGLATLWFDRGNYVVHEAHFDRINMDARLVSYARTADVAPPDPAPAATQPAVLVNLAADFESDDGTKLAGVLDLPPSPKPHVPAIVLIPPGPSASRDFGGDGAAPMYPDLARSFARRGYAVLRYDTRGVGKSGGSPDQTWEQSLADVVAAVAYAGSQDRIDAEQLYVVGYGTGADLALAASASGDTTLAGAVALGPTVLSFRACAQRTKSDARGAFSKSAMAHDPGTLAARSRVPLFVLHSAVAMCGETRDETASYDERLRAGNPRVTILAASDLSARFGGLYDADSAVNTEEFFPYQFDPSTAGAIADWLDNPKTASGGGIDTTQRAPRAHAPPPPPPVSNDMNGELPNPHVSATPERGLAPGVVLPSGVTPPAGQ